MNKEHRMLQAQILREQGLKVKDIAERIGRSERTVYYYLSQEPQPHKKREYSTKLDPYTDTIKSILKDIPDFNRILLFERIKKQGYTGGLSTLRTYCRKLAKKYQKELVIRFETEPGLQAQVDWMYFGKRIINGVKKKVYGFAMIFGYSRKPFVMFTTSMTQKVLLACHILAFLYFGGVPQEILYDNMKTAFIYDGLEGKWRANTALLSFAHHYGFIPKRCRIRRPQTKGKVERFIQYVRGNFYPRVKDQTFSLDELNEKVLQWIAEISEKELRDFKETRNQRFAYEKTFLKALPENQFDCRETIDLQVSRESFITFKTNRYSVPPTYFGETVTLKKHPFEQKATLFHKNTCIRTFNLEESGNNAKKYLENDESLIMEYWKEQFHRKKSRKAQTSSVEKELETCSPAIYEELFTGEEALCNQ